MLVATTDGPIRNEFTYNGRQLLVRHRSLQSGVELSDKRFIMCEGVVCEERTTTNRRILTKFGSIEGTARRYTTTDHLGSVREGLNEGGTLAARYRYDPWGKVELVSGADALVGSFASLDGELNGVLDRAGYRLYVPELGRWLSDDPIKFDGGLNFATYADNNPVARIDPDGLSSIQITDHGVRRHRNLDDQARACRGKLTWGCSDGSADLDCSCEKTECGWQQVFTIRVDIWMNVYDNPRSRRSADEIIREEGKHVKHAISTAERAAKDVERRRGQVFPLKFTCVQGCWVWEQKWRREMRNDPTHSTDPHPSGYKH